MGSKWQSLDLKPGVLAQCPLQINPLCNFCVCLFTCDGRSAFSHGGMLWPHCCPTRRWGPTFIDITYNPCCFFFLIILLFSMFLCDFILKSQVQTKCQIYSLLSFPVVSERENVKEPSLVILCDISMSMYLYLCTLQLYISVSVFCFPSHCTRADPSFLRDCEHSLPSSLSTASQRGLVHLEHHHCISLHEEQHKSYHLCPPSSPLAPQPPAY